MKEGEQILSSTGNLGISRRSYDRLYMNGTEFLEKPKIFQTSATRVAETAKRGRFSRIVFRGIVSADGMTHISNEWSQHVEIAMPLEEFTGDKSWFVSLAHNTQGRDQIVDTTIMTTETANKKEGITSPLVRIGNLANQGFSFSGRIEDSEVEQIYALWGPTFGWDQEKKEVEALQHRLTAGRLIDPSQRNVWMSTVKDENGYIAGLATAELLSRPGENGGVDIVESTEWRVNPEYKGKGIMPTTIAMLNAQILSDLQESSNSGPLIYAECNFASRADRVGSSAGFIIPDRGYAPQILVQNVAVGDGSMLKTPLRDFTFMYLPREIIGVHYSSEQVTKMKSYLNNKV